MKYFSTFSGAGGFELGIERAYVATNKKKEERVREEGASRLRSREGEATAQGHEGLADSHGAGLGEQPDLSGSGQPLCVGFSEIDKYASAVLKHNYPEVKNYGDISKIKWAEVPDFDLLTGGSPCQDFSIAGKRYGLDGERSGLFHEFLRALEEKQPKYFIWENVKGVLSSRSGWDFANIQVAFSEAGYSLWWQVLNAKDFGVPQNRERIFVVGTREGSPREILFTPRNGGQDSRRTGEDVSYTVDANYHKGTNTSLKGRRQLVNQMYGEIVQLNNPKHSNDRVYGEEGISPTLNTMQGGRRQPFIAAMRGRNPENSSDRTVGAPTEQRLEANEKGTSNTLTSVGKDNLVVDEPRIRRLTPTECMRLMSWPDTHCDYGNFDGEVKEISDTQKYKMAGNGVVSNCVEAIVREMIIKNPN